MKKLIFALMIFMGGLSQCTRSAPASAAGVDSAVIQSTKVHATEDSLSKNVATDTLSFNATRAESDDSTAIVFIRTFYEEYLKAFDDLDTDSVKRRYCTPELIEKIAKAEIDYDPFLNAQDFDSNFLTTLQIRKSNAPQEYYVVSYIDGYTKKNVYIAMSLSEQAGRYKIADIILYKNVGNQK